MTDANVTFWLEGVLLPVISGFGLIGGNIQIKALFKLSRECYKI